MIMSSNSTLFIHISLLFTSTLVHPSNASLSEDLLDHVMVERMEKMTLLHFYFHDVVSGEDPTVVQVTGEGLGSTYIIDDALTEGPDRSSRIVGRAQEMYSLAAPNGLALLMVVVFEFTRGKYNGSSISLLGRNHAIDDVREMPIVGGSGLFRLARGYALAHTVSLDPKTANVSVEYNVTVKHY